MKYSIRLTNDAKQDIESIAFYVARNSGSPRNVLRSLSYFYRIAGRVVQILAVADGRRDLQAFLVNRVFQEE